MNTLNNIAGAAIVTLLLAYGLAVGIVLYNIGRDPEPRWLRILTNLVLFPHWPT